jgi:hypothetical protein
MKKIPMWVWVVGLVGVWAVIAKFKSQSFSYPNGILESSPMPPTDSTAALEAKALYAQLKDYDALKGTSQYIKYWPVIETSMAKQDYKTALTYLKWLSGYMG